MIDRNASKLGGFCPGSKIQIRLMYDTMTICCLGGSRPPSSDRDRDGDDTNLETFKLSEVLSV
jgi:hypothetical protein